MKTIRFLKPALILTILSYTSFALSQGNPSDDFESTILLDDGRSQLLMSSQNYNTNYGIYAVFNLKEYPNRPNRRKITSVTIKIRNYKTNLYMGIRDVKLGDAGKRLNQIDVFVQAEVALPGGDNTEKKLTLNGDLYLERGKKVDIERYLMPLNIKKVTKREFDAHPKEDRVKGYKFRCESCNGLGYFLMWPWLGDWDTTANPPEIKRTTIADTEFFYIDGRNIHCKTNYDEKVPDYGRLPGPRCKQGTSIVQ